MSPRRSKSSFVWPLFWSRAGKCLGRLGTVLARASVSSPSQWSWASFARLHLRGFAESVAALLQLGQEVLRRDASGWILVSTSGPQVRCASCTGDIPAMGERMFGDFRECSAVQSPTQVKTSSWLVNPACVPANSCFTRAVCKCATRCCQVQPSCLWLVLRESGAAHLDELPGGCNAVDAVVQRATSSTEVRNRPSNAAWTASLVQSSSRTWWTTPPGYVRSSGRTDLQWRRICRRD